MSNLRQAAQAVLDAFDVEGVMMVPKTLPGRLDALRAALAEEEWKPISTAPINKSVLLWWIPITPNPPAEAVTIGQVSGYEPGKWWHSQRGEYQDLKHVTHWRPLPAPPDKETQCQSK